MGEKRIVMKLRHKGQSRRITLSERPLAIAEVQRAVSQLFPTEKAVQLTYADEDGDKITVSTDWELEEAYNVSTDSSNATIIRLDVETKEVDLQGPPHPSESLLCMSFASLLDLQQQAEEDRKLKAIQEARRKLEEMAQRLEEDKNQLDLMLAAEARLQAKRKAIREEELQQFRIKKAKRKEEETPAQAEAAQREAQREAEEAAQREVAERKARALEEAFEEERKRAKEKAIKEAEDEKKRKEEKERQEYLATHPAREEKLLALISMGFEAGACWEALVVSGDDIEVALEKLVG